MKLNRNGKIYAALPKAGPIGYASSIDVQGYAKSMGIGNHLPGLRDVALWTTDQMCAFADATTDVRLGQLQNKIKAQGN